MMNNFKLSFGRCVFVCFLFIGIMIATRIIYSDSTRFLFLVWNIFLAWVPYMISLSFEKIHVGKTKTLLVLITCWLLFFPNALYIITDIIHLKESEPVPLIYDAILLFSASFAGLALALASVIHTENALRRIIPPAYVIPVIILFLFAGSFGVYLGRFQRWNSWDIIHHPISLLLDISDRITSPFSHIRTWGVTFLLTGLYTVCWLFLKTFQREVISNKNPAQ